MHIVTSSNSIELSAQSSFRHRGNSMVQPNMQPVPQVLQQSGIPSVQLQQPIYNQIQQPLPGYNSAPQLGPR